MVAGELPWKVCGGVCAPGEGVAAAAPGRTPLQDVVATPPAGTPSCTTQLHPQLP